MTMKNYVRVFFLIIVLVMVVLLTSCGGFTHDEKCDWCGDTPTKAYTTSSGDASYICEDCATTCFWCGAKATKHYTNSFGIETFVCNDCYNDIVN